MSAYNDEPGAVQYRLELMEKKIEELQPLPKDVEVLKVELANLGERVKDLSTQLHGLRNAVVGAAITFALSAVGVAITVVLTLGGTGHVG